MASLEGFYETGWGGSLRRRVVTSEWNVEGGRQYVDAGWSFWFSFGYLMEVVD